LWTSDLREEAQKYFKHILKEVKNMKRIIGAFIAISLAALLMIGSAIAGQVMTVLGPISSDDMGVTFMHEHAAFAYLSWFAEESVVPYSRKKVEENWMKILNELKELGVKTVVDPGMSDVGGRDPIALKNCAKKSGINTIAATGLYWEGEGGARYFKWNQGVGRNIEQDIYELFMKEIKVGIGKTGVKAGIIKLASSDPNLTDYEKIVFKAGVRAAKETGLPITTHCQGPKVGPEQMDYFLSLGANPKKIQIGHQNNSTDLNYFLDQLKRPDFYLGFDRTSLGDVKAEDCIIELIKQGHTKRIILSHDYVTTWLGRPFTWPDAWKAAVGNWYPTYIHKKFIPKAKAAGVTDEQIKTILVDNPRRLFDGE
jgi:phosphotriesterase-related protein